MIGKNENTQSSLFNDVEARVLAKGNAWLLASLGHAFPFATRRAARR